MRRDERLSAFPGAIDVGEERIRLLFQGTPGLDERGRTQALLRSELIDWKLRIESWNRVDIWRRMFVWIPVYTNVTAGVVTSSYSSSV